MIMIEIDRDSVHPADDMDDHGVSVELSGNSDVSELLQIAQDACPLPKISGGKATWIIYAGDNDLHCLGVLAQQWSVPHFLISANEKINTIFTDQPAKLMFRYWCQSNPDDVLKALKNKTDLPSKYG
ncbi:hypothetical protein [Pseudemcibacter aquimaris]|uniref:hypothetical protein n=1 Tax=Pseudemcibacter aquimaris TaxID=2857064 RepID=UPI00201189B3|nr:hypothetical protein [Pseudemcibacter aquimaris]MCC3861997.1 hypothetical protein [Pseudemcibacter aquimaris]WDU58749.1 hypothetical protein KW060_00490 [Pseudemcibacter aquimaris]